jgi:methionyl-tRNA formyltransferase
MKKLRIIFYGTPDFAVESLRQIVENGYHVVAVVTAPDKPSGRGKKVKPSAVKQYAIEAGLPILQPLRLKSPEFLTELEKYAPDLQVIVAFRMLPEKVWSFPPLGSFNLHASLLPNYRGAAPINWAIINGEKETGVTTFFLKHEIDTGSILYQEKEPIFDHDTAGSLYHRLMIKGGQLVLKTLEAISKGDCLTHDQDESLAIHKAPKIFKEDCEIHWDAPMDTVRNFVRGLSPYPAAWTTLDNKMMKIFSVEKGPAQVKRNVGEIWKEKEGLWVQVSDGILNIRELQMEGKKRMEAKDFLRGYSM